ncbi:hypothetical protein BAUCODRAFT_139578 [Baudoinia panamericana UAMH 10762]|uniref:Uncharacterized protein n=1 Tax=Baudoinia panamericana (strain UAMH 10762) TaxID=717646 RepID=M2MJG4_BAUPA|nr:uncharacterized protein BAUCODRAFT_139578 [Baudoinia panamericana UAMH 10762]EMC96826.1 hypothetical protein BAUCODRAFT_139578 [Baudoinia panamericana UAMH 10762]
MWKSRSLGQTVCDQPKVTDVPGITNPLRPFSSPHTGLAVFATRRSVTVRLTSQNRADLHPDHIREIRSDILAIVHATHHEGEATALIRRPSRANVRTPTLHRTAVSLYRIPDLPEPLQPPLRPSLDAHEDFPFSQLHINRRQFKHTTWRGGGLDTPRCSSALSPRKVASAPWPFQHFNAQTGVWYVSTLQQRKAGAPKKILNARAPKSSSASSTTSSTTKKTSTTASPSTTSTSTCNPQCQAWSSVVSLGSAFVSTLCSLYRDSYHQHLDLHTPYHFH